MESKWFYITCMVLIIFFSIKDPLKNRINNNFNNKTDTIYIDNSFSIDSLISFMEFMNIKHQDIVLAQAKLESNNFNSRLFRENNNLFGMRHPQSRNNLSTGPKNGYASYKNWKHSVIDYALYQSSYLRKLTDEQYLDYLQKNYADDPHYKKKIKELL